MVEKIVANKEDLTVIADALREAEGTTTEYNVPELGEAASYAIRNATKEAVLYTEQELSESQKSQARTNIGAQVAGDYIAREDVASEVTDTQENPVSGVAIVNYALPKTAIVTTTTDPGAGTTVDYEDGTVIHVYE